MQQPLAGLRHLPASVRISVLQRLYGSQKGRLQRLIVADHTVGMVIVEVYSAVKSGLTAKPCVMPWPAMLTIFVTRVT